MNDNKDNKNEEKLSAEGEPTFSSLGKWLDNFWYHYKAQVIIAAVLIITVAISMSQLISREKIDYNILYAGPHGVTVQDVRNMELAFAEFGDDRTDDGKVNVAVSDVLILSDEEIAEARANGVKLDQNFIQNSKNEYTQQIIGGDAVICMVSPYVHSMLVSAGGLMKISDVLGYVPDNAYGEYGIKLSDTDFKNGFNGINALPDDTILCVRAISTTAKLKGEKKVTAAHEASLELFRKIVAFDAPEGETSQETETSVEN